MRAALLINPDMGRDGTFDVDVDQTSGHELVRIIRDRDTGLRAIVAIHDSSLGPALGGTRFFPYRDEKEALTDVLRLSEGMTLKAAAAGLPLGGGKAVIIGDPRARKSRELLEAYGRFVDTFEGRYITAGDVGTTASDMDIIGSQTRWVVGRNTGGSGDSGFSTALGVYSAMQAGAVHLWGSAGLSGRSVGVEGAGKVGGQLVRLLVDAGAKVVLADRDPEAVERTVQANPGIATASAVLDQEIDVYAPCALGATLNEKTIPSLRARLVCGAANNQLLTAEGESQLHSQGTLWIPDYVANAGGLIQVSSEVCDPGAEEVTTRIAMIGAAVTEMLSTARDGSKTPAMAAREIVQRRLADATGGRA
ncbi:Glu/Leu/Phe/Val family dehydrogenase [Paenarthrobacter aurescens]|uniref:Glu/Leu/Phe/Val family dehydrogenase n=1 Tax=Paenarthrobacter aurescens TaxID=43663 RepID=UPI0035F01166